MKNNFLSFIVIILCLISVPVLSQTESTTETDTTLLGLPGDNLDLYAVLDLFQKSKTIEDFEKSLNAEKTGINNLDLNLDNKVDFIKVETKKKDDDFTFILQVDVSKTEKQDVAVILVSKDKNKKVTMQIVGDPDLYGKDYIVEPKTTTTPAATPNPGYTGSDPLKAPVPTSTTTVVIEQTPIVQYVYSPAYVPYVPPYYYGFYPPYFAAFTVMAVGIYRHNNYYYHGGYGYHGNTTVIHNTYNYNNYNNSRNTSNTVNQNKSSGKYNNSNRQNAGSGARPSTGDVKRSGQGGGARPSTGDVKRSGQGGGARPSTGDINRSGQGGGARPSTGDVNRSGAGGGNRQSASPSTRQSSSGSYSGGNRGGGNRSGGGYSGGGGGRSSSGYSGGGGSRGGSGYSGGGGGRGGGGYSGGGGGRGGGGRGGGGRR